LNLIESQPAKTGLTMPLEKEGQNVILIPRRTLPDLLGLREADGWLLHWRNSRMQPLTISGTTAADPCRSSTSFHLAPTRPLHHNSIEALLKLYGNPS
jgi:hypothetical protein